MPAAASRRPKVKTAVSFDRALECLFSRLVSRANRRRKKEVPCDARDQVTSPKRHETERERARSAIATPATRSSEPASPATTSERALVQQHVERACDGLALGDAAKQRARPLVERRRWPRSDGGGNGAPLEPPRPRERDREDAELGRAARPRGLEGRDWEGARRRACRCRWRRPPRRRARTATRAASGRPRRGARGPRTRARAAQRRASRPSRPRRRREPRRTPRVRRRRCARRGAARRRARRAPAWQGTPRAAPP